MKKCFFGFLLAFCTSVSASDILCAMNLDNINRTITNLNQQGNSLSYSEKTKLYNFIHSNADQCLKFCQGENFAYCNQLLQSLNNRQN